MTRVKSTIATFILFTAFTLSVSAQIGELRNNIAVGINGGANYNTVGFQKHTVKQNGLLGINAGLTARYISEKYFAMICGLQVELNISQRGWDQRFETADGVEDPTRSYSRKMTYLEIPFLAHLAFGREVGAQFFINLGPQLGLLLGDSQEYSGLSEQELANKELYGKKIQNKFDYGITGGLGLEIRTRKAGNFLIEGRYYYGLADFYNSTKKDYFARSSHTTISAKITYLFDIKKK